MTYYIVNIVRPHFDKLRKAGFLKQGTATAIVRTHKTQHCQYVGEVNAAGQAHGWGRGTCEHGVAVEGMFMCGAAHGQLFLTWPPKLHNWHGLSTYEFRQGIRHGKETFRFHDGRAKNNLFDNEKYSSKERAGIPDN